MTLAHLENVDQEAVLRTLQLNPRDPHTQALLLICNRYALDPLLKHIVLIQGRPYVTRDGYLAVAHASGEFDGIEILEEGEDESHWWARAAVYRKDMARPFTYRGRHPKKGGNQQYGPEMAVKCAEVHALRRAFNVTGIGAADERWDADTYEQIDPGVAADLAERLNRLGGDARKAFFKHFGDRRPQQLSPDDEDAALAFTAELENAAETPEVEDAPAEIEAGVIDAQAVGIRAGEVFADKVDPESIPKGQRTRLLKALRHALVFAATGGEVSGAKDADGEQLYRVWQLLDGIEDGSVTFVFNANPTKGVEFHWPDKSSTAVKWTELHLAEADAEVERRAESGG